MVTTETTQTTLWKLSLREKQLFHSFLHLNSILIWYFFVLLSFLNFTNFEQIYLELTTLGVQTFANRKFRECKNSWNFWHKLSRMRLQNLFREHKLSRMKHFRKFCEHKLLWIKSKLKFQMQIFQEENNVYMQLRVSNGLSYSK